MSNLGDFGLADRRLQPDWIFKDIDNIDLDKSLWEKVRLVNFGRHVAKFYNLFLIRTLMSPFLLHLRIEFKKKIDSIERYEADLKAGKQNPSEPYRIKMRSYMSHDTFLSPIMIILGLIDTKCVEKETTLLKNLGCTSKPPVAAGIVWELNQRKEDDKNQFYINATYRGKYFNICKLDPKDTDEDFSCKWETFRKFIASETFSNWKYICEKYGSDETEHFDYRTHNKVVVDKDDLWNGLSISGLTFGFATLLFIITLLWMCMQVFRYGVLNQ